MGSDLLVEKRKISGEVPTSPVVSARGGVLFERRLIEKHLETSGETCPVTGEPLSKDDLIPVRVSAPSVIPRPASATSLPSLLRLVESEWDGVMLETHRLKEALEQSRQQLTQVLYQYDAACRVIARLRRERDEARASVERAQRPVSSSVRVCGSSRLSEVFGGVDGPSLSDLASEETGAVVERASEVMTASGGALQAARREMKKPAGLASGKELAGATSKWSKKPFRGAGAGVTSLIWSETAVCGGEGGQVRVVTEDGFGWTGRHGGEAVSGLSAHRDKGLLLSAGGQTVKVWHANRAGAEGEWEEVGEFEPHGSGGAHVHDVHVHASGEMALSVGDDGNWALTDLFRGRVVRSVASTAPGPRNARLACIAGHPDGLIFAVGGAGGVVSIWDARSASPAASFPADHADAVLPPLCSLDFSENGYLMAAGDVNGTATVWDLRKGADKATWRLHGQDPAPATVRFDASGRILAAARGSNVTIGAAKTGEIYLTNDETNQRRIQALCFGTDARTVYTAALDGTVQLFQI